MITGKYCDISKDFEYGKNFKCGSFVKIEPDVIVGDNVILGNQVTLKSGTRFMNDIRFADYCKTTGLCILGNFVSVRTGACISKAVITEDKCFIGPGVMTNHTQNVVHQRKLPDIQVLTRIKYGAIIGSTVSIRAGITIGSNVIIANASIVTKDIKESGIYFGLPLRKIMGLPKGYFIEGESEYYEFSVDDVNKYLPHLQAK